MSLPDIFQRIDQLQEQVAAHGKLSDEVLKKFQYKLRLDWNYHSNALEGNSLTRQETRSVMINNITIEGKPLKDVLEIRGHDNVITDILRMGKGELRISEKRIRDIHAAIIHEDDPEKQKSNVGKWKTANNFLTNYRNDKFYFTEWTEVPEKMHELLNWLNAAYDKVVKKTEDALHPVVLAFEFHLRYVTIHPFYDGNGRTSRIFMNIILISLGFPPVIVKLEEKDAYNQYLADIQAYGGSPDLFYEFMSGLLVRSLELELDAIEGRDIEEKDDLEKEILIWKKQLKTDDIEVLPKSHLQIQHLYKNGVRRLFEEYLKKIEQFDDVFQEKKIRGFVNGGNSNFEGIEYIDKKVEASNSEEIQDFFLEVSLKGFKKNGINAFNYSTDIRVEFHQYVYSVNWAGTKIEKLYSEYLTDTLIEEVVKGAIKRDFEQIKLRVKN